MEIKKIKYNCDGHELHGEIVYDSSWKKPKPAIIVAHAWKGRDEFVRKKAIELAELGYAAFTADVYGGGDVVESNDEALALMLPLFKNRRKLRQRITAAYDTVKDLDIVDESKIGAIGFCFGGLTVIELLRSGVDIKGAASFHGILGNRLGEEKAFLEPNSDKIKGSLLILHGNDDTMVSQEDITSIQKEFTEAGIDWQMVIYGHTMHAFTNPEAHDKEMGLMFNKKSKLRSWQSMRQFFEEIME